MGVGGVSGWAGAPDVLFAGRSRRLATALKLAVTVAVLAYAVRDISPASLGRVLQHVALPPALLALIPFLLIPLLGGLRWWCVLRAMRQARCPLPMLSRLFAVSIVLGQMLPSLAADGLRGWLVARRGVAVRAAWHSIVLERCLMLLGLLSLLCLTQDQAAQRLGFVTGVQLLLAAVVGAAALLFVADRLLPSRWAWARTLVADTRAVAASPWGAGAMMVSLVSNLNFVAAGVLLAPVVGMSFSWGDGLVIIPLMTAVTTLPISLGGWGVREGVLVTLLARLGVPADTALIYSLLFGLGGVMAGLPGFLAWWLDGPNGAAA